MKKKKYIFQISCGICGKVLAQTSDEKESLYELAEKKKLKRVRIEYFEGNELQMIEEFFVCNKCWDKIWKKNLQ